MRVYERTKQALLEPTRFFKSIKKDKGIRKEVHYISILAVVIYIFLTYYWIGQWNSLANYLNETMNSTMFINLEFTARTYSYIYLFLVVTFILLSFLRYWVTHWCVLLLGGRQSYVQTYKAMVYSLAPEYITAPLFVVLVIGLPFVIVQASLLYWMLWSVVLIAYLIPRVYEIYLRILAMSILQKVSKLRAFLAIFILGFIAQLLLVLVIEVVLIAVVVGIMAIF